LSEVQGRRDGLAVRSHSRSTVGWHNGSVDLAIGSSRLHGGSSLGRGRGRGWGVLAGVEVLPVVIVTSDVERRLRVLSGLEVGELQIASVYDLGGAIERGGADGAEGNECEQNERGSELHGSRD